MVLVGGNTLKRPKNGLAISTSLAHLLLKASVAAKTFEVETIPGM
jgi:hypothetical protein